MDGVPDNIINQESKATHAQRLSGESPEFVWSEMMHEQIAAHEIERPVGERQSERIAGHCAVAAVQVAASAIEKGNGQVKFWGKSLSDFGRNKARSGGDFEQRSAMTGNPRYGVAHQLLGSGHAAEPLVKHLKIADRGGDFALGSRIGIE